MHIIGISTYQTSSIVGESDIPVVFLGSHLRRSATFANEDLPAPTGNLVDHAILFSQVDGEGTLAKLQKAAFRLDGRCFMNFLLFPFILSDV